jgi:hypothetical protein
MMSSPDKREFDDQVLIRYFLGSLPEEEAERLDELSIADDAFAWRLSAVENDLVDTYVRGELSAEDLAQFKKSYLSSPNRLQKVEFAEALRSLDAKTATAAAQPAPARTPPSPKPKEESSKGLYPWRWISVPRLALQWGFAGGAVAMLFASGYLFVENGRLRKSAAESRERQAMLDRQLNDQLSANTEMQKELERLREPSPGSSALKTIAFLLLPQTRGIGHIATISLPPGTGEAKFRLQLETDDFPRYRVAVKDSTSNRVIWQSTALKSTSVGENKEVSIRLPFSLLEPGSYFVELSGLGANGSSEPVTSYVFRLVKK